MDYLKSVIVLNDAVIRGRGHKTSQSMHLTVTFTCTILSSVSKIIKLTSVARFPSIWASVSISARGRSGSSELGRYVICSFRQRKRSPGQPGDGGFRSNAKQNLTCWQDTVMVCYKVLYLHSHKEECKTPRAPQALLLVAWPRL